MPYTLDVDYRRTCLTRSVGPRIFSFWIPAQASSKGGVIGRYSWENLPGETLIESLLEELGRCENKNEDKGSVNDFVEF